MKTQLPVASRQCPALLISIHDTRTRGRERAIRRIRGLQYAVVCPASFYAEIGERVRKALLAESGRKIRRF